MEQPPEIDTENLDFSQFHPLDHQLWQCRGYPGGWRRHLQHRWEFQWYSVMRRVFYCPFGKHRVARVWKRLAPTESWKPPKRVCVDCMKPQP